MFGEGFGGNIKIGKHYRPDVAFILFDVYMYGKWCSREEVWELAQKLGLDYPPDLGMMTEEDIIAFVKSKLRILYIFIICLLGGCNIPFFALQERNSVTKP